MTEKEWQVHFAKQEKSGIGVSEYCKANKLSSSRWYYFKKRLSKKKTSHNFAAVKVAKVSNSSSFNMNISDEGTAVKITITLESREAAKRLVSQLI